MSDWRSSGRKSWILHLSKVLSLSLNRPSVACTTTVKTTITINKSSRNLQQPKEPKPLLPRPKSKPSALEPEEESHLKAKANLAAVNSAAKEKLPSFSHSLVSETPKKQEMLAKSPFPKPKTCIGKAEKMRRSEAMQKALTFDSGLLLIGSFEVKIFKSLFNH